MSDQVRITDVTLRDGLQLEAPLPLDKKLRLFRALNGVKYARLEFTSFAHPKWMPQFADADEFSRNVLIQTVGSPLMAFTPNEKGLDRLLSHPIEWISLFVGVSETFHQKNVNQPLKDTLTEMKNIVERAHQAGKKVRIYASTVFGCPYEGKIPAKHLYQVLEQLAKLSPEEIALSDTIGVAVPSQVKDIAKHFKGLFPVSHTAFHFHNTYGFAVASALTAAEEGARMFDGSTGGVGGCPYAKGATGNVASEDLWYAFYRSGLAAEPPGESVKFVLKLLKEMGLPVRSRLAEVWEKGGDIYGHAH